LSQRLRLSLEEAFGDADMDLLQVYRRLRLINPSPYLFMLDLGDEQFLGSSPEVMVRKRGEHIAVRPIAGTRPRGQTPEEDQALARELLEDEKERAEHIMLLDLGRNDIGRACQVGSVEVAEQMVIERYSHVMHLVSHVTGRLSPGLGWSHALGATFPAGTLSGAPKVRAMQIIDEVEPAGRRVYGGAVGYIGFDGDMDFGIAIRTLHVRDGWVDVQAGAGIVVDSDPRKEWQETLHKAGALLSSMVLPDDAP
jgi:anthranilate synthase component 1